MFKHIDMESALRRIAERRIEEAMQAGKFDKIEGQGQPIEIEPAPADENARLMWWALKIMKQNDVVPDEVRWRKAIDQLKAMLPAAKEETQVRELCRKVNELVHRVNTLGTNAIKDGPTGVDEAAELAAWAARSEHHPTAAPPSDGLSAGN
ncbi:MAG: DUF1992 domain-containing protein [Tepidisphaeraceae bacterium]